MQFLSFRRIIDWLKMEREGAGEHKVSHQFQSLMNHL
jgi:hypothetical protein